MRAPFGDSSAAMFFQRSAKELNEFAQQVAILAST
jgi:hypothetical protein